MWLTTYLLRTVEVICIIILIKYLKDYYYAYRLVQKIPGPAGLPILENFFDFFMNIDNIFYILRERARQYYPVYKLIILHVLVVNILKPDDIEQILSSSKHLSKSRIYGFLHRWLGTGLLTSSGAKWQTRRRILTPAFHFNILQQFVAIFNEETENFVEILNKVVDQEVDIHPYVTHYTLRSIMETAMGSNPLNQDSQKKYRSNIYKIGKLFFRRLSRPWLRNQTIYELTSAGREEKGVIDTLHGFSKYIIAERERTFDLGAVREEIGGKGSSLKKRRLAMLDLLLAAKMENGAIDSEGIREEVDTFLFEGHDTTAAIISLLLMLLACHKDYQDKIYEEILQVLGPNESNPTVNQLQELKYMEMCIKEGLRIYPSVPFISRYSGEEYTTTTGYRIPKGIILHIHIFDLHRDPEFWPEPEKFDPERFSPENAKGRHPFAYVPFSAGPRNCIGQRFAMLELKAVLCGVLREFIIEPVDQQGDIKFIPDLILRTKNGVRVKFIKRGV